MEGNSWRPTVPDAAVVAGGGGVVDTGDWRNQLQPEARQRIVNRIMEALKRHLPISIPEGLTELQKIAVRFEEKIYTAATSQSDYLRRISMKMLSMETKTQQAAPINPSMSKSAGPNQNPSDPASLIMQPQGSNQGQSLPVSMVNQPAVRQQILPQNIQNTNLTSIQGSTNIPSGLSSIPGSGQSTLSGVGMSGIGQNSATSSLRQAAAADIYSNSQRQMQGRQQQIISQQQQSQNQLLYQQQLERQLIKQKMQPSSLLQPHMQQQQQQQQLLGSLPNVSNMQQQRSMQMLQQSKGAVPQLQQNQQASMALLQPQASVDSTGQTGHLGLNDWQEEIYQKDNNQCLFRWLDFEEEKKMEVDKLNLELQRMNNILLNENMTLKKEIKTLKLSLKLSRRKSLCCVFVCALTVNFLVCVILLRMM